MKKLHKIWAALFAAFFIFGAFGCKANLMEDSSGNQTENGNGNQAENGDGGNQQEDINHPTVITEPTTGIGVADGTSVISADGVLTITPTAAGLLIVKNHPDSWEHNTIHIKNITKGYENFKIDNVNQTTNEIIYPFVKEGDTYRVWIEKQETNWTNWGETQKVDVTAVGGKGNSTIYFDNYVYDPENYEFTFKNLTYVKPDIGDFSYNLEGPVFNGKPWTNGVESKYGAKYALNDFTLKISGSEVISFLDNATKIGIVFEMGYSYNNFYYKSTLISEIFYDKNFPTSSLLTLTGGNTLPKVYITSSNGYSHNETYHFGDSWETGTISINDPVYGLSTTDVLIKDRGNSTKWPADNEGKTPFSLKFPDKTKILGMPKSKRWVLMANYFDRSLIRTDFAGYLGNNVFNTYWNASFKPVEVYINNEFMGVYDLGENNKIEKNRVNIQSIEDYVDLVKQAELVDVNGDGKVDIEDCGFMVEIDTATNWNNTITVENYKTEVAADWGGAERIYFYSSEKCIPMTLKDPDFGDGVKYPEDLCLEMGKYAKSKIDAFEQMLYSDDFINHYRDYIDVNSFVDWYLINEFAKNSDANFQKSVPVVYDPKDGKLHMGPNWDFDLAFGNFDHGYDIIGGGNSTVDDVTGWYIHGGKKDCDENALRIQIQGNFVQTYWINRLFEDPAFKTAVKNRWIEKRGSLKNAIENQISNYANLVYDSIPKSEEKLPRLGKYSWNGPSGYANRDTYEKEITYFYQWCLARYNWMDKEISKWNES